MARSSCMRRYALLRGSAASMLASSKGFVPAILTVTSIGACVPPRVLGASFRLPVHCLPLQATTYLAVSCTNYYGAADSWHESLARESPRLRWSAGAFERVELARRGRAWPEVARAGLSRRAEKRHEPSLPVSLLCTRQWP